MISVFIFTSNDFRPWKIEERERERARRSHRSKMIAPLRSIKLTPSNPIIDHRDRLAISEPRAKRETERERRENREIVAPPARSSHHRRDRLAIVLKPAHTRLPTNPLTPHRSHCADKPTMYLCVKTHFPLLGV